MTPIKSTLTAKRRDRHFARAESSKQMQRLLRYMLENRHFWRSGWTIQEAVQMCNVSGRLSDLAAQGYPYERKECGVTASGARPSLFRLIWAKGRKVPEFLQK